MLIQSRHLKEFVNRRSENFLSMSKRKAPAKDQDSPREICTISGGPVGGESGRIRRIQAWQAWIQVFDHTIYTTTLNQAIPTLSFDAGEAQVLHQSHNDALVITLIIAHVRVHHVLVDGGSSTDFLTLQAFDRMNIGRERLKHCLTPLVRFGEEWVYPVGSIELPIIFRESRCTLTKIVQFLVVDLASAYNAILGGRTIHSLEVVPSTYHQIMKFPTP